MHRPAQNQMIRSPSVIRTAVRSGLISAAEIGQGERCDLLLYAQFNGRVVKRGQRRVELREQRLLSWELRAVRIETAERAEENLALQAERGPDLHDLRHLLELRADARGRKDGLYRSILESGSQRRALL